MATESLIVELDAKTQKLDAKLKATNERIKGLESSSNKTSAAFKSFAGNAAMAAGIAATAITAAAVEASKFSKELQIASNRAGESVEEMQSLAFATGTVGISLEKLGDISKDTREKIGEFLATGGGGFKDFIDVMDLTGEQARDTAEEFSNLSGPDILQEMVTRMERAGVSSEKMSFALEGVASDATDLIPLLEDSGKKLKDLQQDFDSLDSTLTSFDLKKIDEVGRSLDKASTVFSAESRGLVAEYSEQIIKAIDVTTVIVQKTVDGFNVIATGWGNLIDIAGAAINDFINGTSTLTDVINERSEESKEKLNELFGENFYDLGKEAGTKFADGMAEGIEENDKPLEVVVTGGRELTEWEKLNEKQRFKVKKDGIRAAKILADEFLEDNKALRAGLVIADTAMGIQRQFADLPYPAALASSAVIAASGAVQLSNILSSGKGGGQISNSGSGGGAPQAQDDFQQETESQIVDVSEIGAGGTGTSQLNVTFNSDGGSPAEQFLAESLNDGMRRGSIEVAR